MFLFTNKAFLIISLNFCLIFPCKLNVLCEAIISPIFMQCYLFKLVFCRYNGYNMATNLTNLLMQHNGLFSSLLNVLGVRFTEPCDIKH